jgi:TrmH family RNA methyltransferase
MLSRAITSPRNAKVKMARALARRRERQASGKFLIEGTRLITEGVRAGHVPALVFYGESALRDDPRAEALIRELREQTEEVFEVDAKILESLTQVESPQGIVAVFDFPRLDIPSTANFILILDQLRDPGNLGTILRSAWAAGVDVVYLSPTTVDAFNPKVTRAAMGAHFRLPIRQVSWEEIAGAMKNVPRVYLAEARGELDYRGADWTRPLALIIGGEAEGAGEAARSLATARVSIPLAGEAESLNAAMAATVLLFHAASQS